MGCDSGGIIRWARTFWISTARQRAWPSRSMVPARPRIAVRSRQAQRWLAWGEPDSGLSARDILYDEAIEGVLVSIAQAAAPSTAFGGPPPPRFARRRNGRDV